MDYYKGKKKMVESSRNENAQMTFGITNGGRECNTEMITSGVRLEDRTYELKLHK